MTSGLRFRGVGRHPRLITAWCCPPVDKWLSGVIEKLHTQASTSCPSRICDKSREATTLESILSVRVYNGLLTGPHDPFGMGRFSRYLDSSWESFPTAPRAMSNRRLPPGPNTSTSSHPKQIKTWYVVPPTRHSAR
jgi:hypothetical protein